jgi:hypothetical protein
VRQLLLSKLPRDSLAAQIDDYLRAEGRVEALILAAHDGTRNWHPSQLAGLQAEFQRLDRRRRDLYDAADRQESFINLTPALRAMIKTCGENPDVGALLITGAGTAFCAGGNVKGMGAHRDKKKLERSPTCRSGSAS